MSRGAFPAPTPRQIELMEFVADFQARTGMVPTWQEIGESMGITDGSVRSMVHRLERDGFVERAGRRPRSLRLKPKAWGYLGVSRSEKRELPGEGNPAVERLSRVLSAALESTRRVEVRLLTTLRAWAVATKDLGEHFEGLLGDCAELLSEQSFDREGDYTLRFVGLRHIAAVLRLCGDNKARAARILGIDVKTLFNKRQEIEGEEKLRAHLYGKVEPVDGREAPTHLRAENHPPRQEDEWGSTSQRRSS